MKDKQASQGGWAYTHIRHKVRIALGLNNNEYCILDVIYTNQTNPLFNIDGFAKIGAHKLAEFFGLSSGTVHKIFAKMERLGFLEFGTDKSLKKATEKYFMAVLYDQADQNGGVQKVNGGVQKVNGGVQKVNGKRSKSEHKHKLTEIKPNTNKGESEDSPEFSPIEEVYLFPAPFQGLDESDLKKKIGPKHLSLLKEGFSNEEFLRAAISMLEDGRFFIYLDWLEYKKKSRKGYTSLSHGLGPLLRTFSGFTEAELRAAYDKSVSNGYSGIFPEKRVASINGQKSKQNGITQICSNETAEELADAFVAGGGRW